MRYEGRLYRPPSEADALILQATIGCSWNHCTYCDMYRDKAFSQRSLDEVLEDVRAAGRAHGSTIEKVFVADGDALVLDLDCWETILATCRETFPRLRRVSAYATALNLLQKSVEELSRLAQQGLGLLYLGPETGDDETFKRIAKGSGFAEHVEAAQRMHAAGIDLSTIFLLGAGGTARSAEHAEASARLIGEMDPAYLSLLTLTVIPGTPIHRLVERGAFELPDIGGMLREIRMIIDQARPTNALFRTNHASNYLPLAGRLPADRERLVALVDRALAGKIRLRPEWARGL